jgi:nucleotide-binding universal stress UspA family protein
MALADILIHMDDSKNCEMRLDVAIDLAVRFKARLTGLYVITHKYYQPRKGDAETVAETVHRMFEDKVARTGIETRWQCIDWSVIGVGITEIINHHAHYTDLLVVGQAVHDVSGKAANEAPADLPERLVLGAGRPVLIVPYAGTFARVGERVLVAWKAGRESTRAVNDALPILKQAQRVDILAIDSSETYEDDGETLCSNICDHLERHGVKAEPERMIVSNSSVGDALLNRTCEEGFDLVVMGAYAHTPQGKMALGSVASHLLKQMTVPVLMSH